MLTTVTSNLPRLPPRRPDVHKAEVGRVLILGGCVGMAGAPCLTANAAYRAGAGLVRLAVPTPIQNVVSTLVPLATTVGLPITEVGTVAGSRYIVEMLLSLADDNDVLVIGPGLGREPTTAALVRDLLATVHKPVVLDADGLRALGPLPQIAPEVGARLILTPHPGEFAYLVGRSSAEVQADRRAAVEQFVQQIPAVVVLKGHQTLVADPQRLAVNTSGNPGMATAGSGDVLAGVIAALVGQHLSNFDAAVLGAYVHGLAGDTAAAQLGEVSLTALDIIDALPTAFRTLAR